MKNLLLLLIIIISSPLNSQTITNLNHFEDLRFNNVTIGQNDTYIITGQPENAITDFGYGKIMRVDSNFELISNVIDFPNENDDMCCPSTPNAAIDIDGDNFAVYGAVDFASSNLTYFSFSKYDNESTEAIVDKRIWNSTVLSLLKGVNENYALIQVGDYDGTGDYSFSVDATSVGSRYVLLAFDDNLDENWHTTIPASNPTFVNGYERSKLSLLENGNISFTLDLSFDQMTLNGNTYGSSSDYNRFIIQVDPTNQSIVEPPLVFTESNVQYVEDPIESGFYYLLHDSFNASGYDEIIKYNSSNEIVARTGDLADKWLSFDPIKIYFENDEIIVVGNIDPSGSSGDSAVIVHNTYHLDRDLNLKYIIRLLSDSLGEDGNINDRDKHQFISYENGHLRQIQSYSDISSDNSTYTPDIGGVELLATNGGINSVVFDATQEFSESERNSVILGSIPATEVFNYVEKNSNGDLIPSDKHISYAVFPDGFDFTQYDYMDFTPGDTFDFVPNSWFAIPSGWSNVQRPIFQYDNELGLYFFEITSSISYNGYGNFFFADKVSILKVYMTTEPLALSNDEFDSPLSLNVYPNPTDGILNIDNVSSIEKAQLYDIHGRQISTSITNKMIDISSFPSGVYLLKLEDYYGNSETMRVIKE